MDYFEHFKVSELFINNSDSDIITCVRSGYIDSLLLLVMCLDSFRQTYNIPIRITSSYRNKEHNKRVGGVATSQHLIGQAVDFTCINFDFKSFSHLFMEFLKTKGAWDAFIGQVIIYTNRHFIHMGLRSLSHKKMEIYEKREY